MVNIIENFKKGQLEKIRSTRSEADFDLSFRVGDTVRVKYKISEGDNTRLQAFVGVVIAKGKNLSNYCSTFTVRKISDGVGVERKFNTYSPLISSIELVKKGIIRRAKLYYLRDLTGKATRIREKLDFSESKNS